MARWWQSTRLGESAWSRWWWHAVAWRWQSTGLGESARSRNGGGTQWPGGGNRPGWNNRPGIGGGNIGHIGDNLGVVNRPNYGGNTFVNGGGGWGRGNWGLGGANINNINTNITDTNFNNNVFGGGWGRGWGGGWGGGFGGGWASPYYGNWYRGFGGNIGSFWGGYGLGALTSFGLGSAFGASSYYSALGSYGYGGYGYPVYGGYGYGMGYGVYDYFPTWGVSSIGGWGLGSLASTWLSTNYVNPYNLIVVRSQPTAATVVYDYSQPINVDAAPPAATAADSTEQVFSAARDSFKAGDYQRGLDLIDQVIKETPNAPVVHEFRALCLFALKRYEEAATVAYAVLSAGPCWNWATLVGLYPDVDTYTNQLRALEAAVRSDRSSTPSRFLLAYHYLVQGNNDAAGTEFADVVKLEPKDQLSASFAKALTKAKESMATPATATPPAAAGRLRMWQRTRLQVRERRLRPQPGPRPLPHPLPPPRRSRLRPHHHLPLSSPAPGRQLLLPTPPSRLRYSLMAHSPGTSPTRVSKINRFTAARCTSTMC